MIITIDNSKLKEDLLVFLIIYSTDTFVTFANVNESIRTFFEILLLICSLWIIFRKSLSKELKGDKAFFCLTILSFLILASIISNNDFTSGNFIKLFVLFCGWSFSQYLTYNEFKESFSRVMVFIAAFSIITYILGPLLIRLNLPEITNTSGTTVKALIFSNVSVASNGYFRNYGPFWEPGVFQIYLNIALFFELQKENVSVKRFIVLLVAILTTVSTTGYVCLALSVFAYFFKNNKASAGKILLGIGIIFGIVFALNSSAVYDLVFAKLNPNSSSYESAQSRFGSIYANLQCIYSNPLLGMGVTKLSKYMESFRIGHNYYFFSNTNGLLMNFSIFGSLFGVIYLYNVCKFSFEISFNKLIKTLFLFVILIELFSEPLVNSLLFNIIVFLHFKGDLFDE